MRGDKERCIITCESLCIFSGTSFGPFSLMLWKLSVGSFQADSIFSLQIFENSKFQAAIFFLTGFSTPEEVKYVAL